MDERLDVYLRFIQEDEVVDEAVPKIAGMGVSTAIFAVPMVLSLANKAYKAIFVKGGFLRVCKIK